MTRRRRPLVRVALLDAHHAARLGTQVRLRGEPGLEPVGGAAMPGELWHVLRRSDPDVVVIARDAGDESRLEVVRRVRAAFRARVVLVTADPGEALLLAARRAGVSAVVDRGEPPARLAEAVRAAGAEAQGRPAAEPWGLAA